MARKTLKSVTAAVTAATAKPPIRKHKTGPAKLHAKERVLTAGQTRKLTSSGISIRRSA